MCSAVKEIWCFSKVSTSGRMMDIMVGHLEVCLFITDTMDWLSVWKVMRLPAIL
jgi:hypothetical protein